MTPVDLSPGGVTRASIIALTQERDHLAAQMSDVEGLYDELTRRDEEIERLRADKRGLTEWVARLESRGIEDLQATNEHYRTALEEIVAKKGRGGLRIAQEALEF